MDLPGIKDTAAYRVIRQITDHTWGPDAELSDSEIQSICVSFYGRGGSWERLMAGDVRNVARLESAVDELLAPRQIGLDGSFK